MKSTRSLILRVAVFAAVMVVLLVGVLRTIARPVAGDTDTYTAVFTDANGLVSGDDVRLFGVQVGKVVGLTLVGARARVSFTVQRAHPLFDTGTVAIRYQNLSGQRYLELRQPTTAGARQRPQDTIGAERTVASFDITTLFNGLQPVLAELTPADLNRFATSLLAVIQGDGTGIGPALDAIDTLSRYATDRQTVISTLVRNLSQVSEELGGKSGNTVALLTQLTGLFHTLEQKLDGLIDFGLTIPPVLVPADDLLAQLGLTGDPNHDLDSVLRAALPDPKHTVEVLNRLPALLQSFAAMIPATGSEVNRGCSHGAGRAPQPLQALIDGRRITLCNR